MRMSEKSDSNKLKHFKFHQKWLLIALNTRCWQISQAACLSPKKQYCQSGIRHVWERNSFDRQEPFFISRVVCVRLFCGDFCGVSTKSGVHDPEHTEQHNPSYGKTENTECLWTTSFLESGRACGSGHSNDCQFQTQVSKICFHVLSERTSCLPLCAFLLHRDRKPFRVGRHLAIQESQIQNELLHHAVGDRWWVLHCMPLLAAGALFLQNCDQMIPFKSKFCALKKPP